MKTRGVILGVLIISLIGLGGMYFHMNKRIEGIQTELNNRKIQDELEAKERQINALQEEIRKVESRGGTQHQASMANAQPARDDHMAQARQLEDVRQELAITKAENEILLDEYKGRSSEEDEMMKHVNNARLVGKVQSYDREHNILVFMPVGQPSLSGGQELAIRRNRAIFAYLNVDELDQQSGAYVATVRLDDYLLNTTSVEPIGAGDEIIIPPDSLQGSLDDTIKKEREILSPKNNSSEGSGEIPFLN